MKHGPVHRKVMRKVRQMLQCTDCHCQPWDMGEDFYVRDGLWILNMPPKKRDDVICIGCFEKRLGRKLKRRDFKPWFRGNRWYGDKHRTLNNPPSARLMDRMELST